MQAQLWTVSGLAVELGRDRRTIAKQLEGLAPDEEETRRGGAVTRRWLLARVIAHLYAAEASGTASEFGDQRERLNAAQADKVEMENAIRRGEIADLKDVERYWSDAVSAARAKLLGMPTKLSPQLVHIGDANAIAGLIRAEVYAALTELADYEPPVDAEQPSANGAAGVPNVRASAAADGEPVGGRKAKAVERKQRRAGPVAN